MRIRISAVLAATVLVVSCTAHTVHSTVTLKQGTGDLARRAQAIVQGRVTGVSQEWNEDKTMIFTVVTITADRVIKGAGTVFTVRQPGGMIDGKGVKVSGMPSFASGEEIVVFLEPFEASGAHSGSHRVVGMGQGKFRVDISAATGKKIIRPSADMPDLLDAQGRIVEADQTPLDLDEFIQSIRKELAPR